MKYEQLVYNVSGDESKLYCDEVVSVEAKQAPGADAIAECRRLADSVADRILRS